MAQADALHRLTEAVVAGWNGRRRSASLGARRLAKASQFFRTTQERKGQRDTTRRQGGATWELELDRVFTPAETLTILTAAEHELEAALASGRAIRARDAWLTQIAIHSGLRLSEVAALCVGDLLLGEPAAIVVQCGKGKKRRVVVVSDELRRSLENFLTFKKERGESVEPAAVLFHSSNRPGRALSPRALQLAFQRFLKRAGVAHKGLHTCRHTYATNLLKASKGNLRLVQKQLGHSSLAVTQIYLSVFASDVQEAADSLYRDLRSKKARAEP